MDERTTSFIAIALAIMFMGTVGAASTPSTSSLTLLHQYSVPNSIITHLTQANLTYNGLSYVALYNNGALAFVINGSDSSFVTGTGNIYNVIQAYTVNQSYSKVNFTQIGAQMHAYEASSAGPLADCMMETGLSGGATCTLSNICESCRTVPVCSKVLSAVGGPTTPFGYGLMQFENNATVLDNAFANFYSYINNVNIGNAATLLPAMSAEAQNISDITSSLGENPIFPPPQTADFQLCTGAGSGFTSNIPLSGGVPWYCNAVGFCQYLTYNTTLINGINTELTNAGSSSITKQGIESVASAANTTEATYITPVIVKEKGTVLSGILNTTLYGYSGIVNGSKTLLSHISNATLSSELSRLEGNYSTLTKNYASINLTSYNSILAGQFSNVSKLYSFLNSSYSALSSTAQNNTNDITNLELKSKTENPTLASLAFRQILINKELSGSIGNTTQLSQQLNAVRLALNGMGINENPVSALSRYVGGHIAVSVAGLLHLSYDSNVAFAPWFASMPALILFIISLLLLLHALFPGKAVSQSMLLKGNAKKSSNKGKLVVFAFVMLLYLILSLALSSTNNSSVTASTVSHAITSSNTIVIALNGTQTSGMLSCASSISAHLMGMNKTVIRTTINGIKCVSNGSIETTSACLNGYVHSGTPVVMLTNSSVNRANMYSFYGTMINYGGNSTYLGKCTPDELIG